jgi:hypothetical protein
MLEFNRFTWPGSTAMWETSERKISLKEDEPLLKRCGDDFEPDTLEATDKGQKRTLLNQTEWLRSKYKKLQETF